jgi:hypothetical protein
MNISELKRQFDTNIVRLKKGMEFMYGSASPEAKKKWKPEYTKLLRETSDLEYQLQQARMMEGDKCQDEKNSGKDA